VVELFNRKLLEYDSYNLSFNIKHNMFLYKIILGLNFNFLYCVICKVLKAPILLFFLYQVGASKKTKKDNLNAVKVKI